MCVCVCFYGIDGQLYFLPGLPGPKGIMRTMPSAYVCVCVCVCFYGIDGQLYFLPRLPGPKGITRTMTSVYVCVFFIWYRRTAVLLSWGTRSKGFTRSMPSVCMCVCLFIWYRRTAAFVSVQITCIHFLVESILNKDINITMK